MSIQNWGTRLSCFSCTLILCGCSGSGWSPWSSNEPSSPYGEFGTPISGTTPDAQPSAVAPASANDSFNPVGATERMAEAVVAKFRSVGEALTPETPTVAATEPTSLFNEVSQVNPEVHIASAKISLVQGQVDEAVRHYEDALEIEPNHRLALINYARMLDQVDRPTQAEAIYRRATQAFPEDAVVFNDLGLFYARRGRQEESLSSLSAAVRLAPTSQLYRNNISTLLVQMGHFDEAYAHLAEVNSRPDAHYNLGVLLENTGHRDDAMQHYQYAQQLRDLPSQGVAESQTEAPSNGPTQATTAPAYTRSGAWQPEARSDSPASSQIQQPTQQAPPRQERLDIPPTPTYLPPAQ